MPEFGLTDAFIFALLGGAQGVAPSRYGIVVAWTMAAIFLLIGAGSLRLFDLRPAGEREPLWLTADPGRPMAVSALIAVGEEVFFRGYLQSSALSLAEPVYALFAVNLLFALIHFRGGLTFALSAGFFGMTASVMTLASASLMPAIVMHAGWNVLVGIARRREALRIPAAEAAPDPTSP